VGFTAAVLSVLIGIAYLARSMQCKQKPGSDIAGLSSVLAFLSAIVIVVSSGLQLALIYDSYADSGGVVVMLLMRMPFLKVLHSVHLCL
jgi:hypothetical protein